MQEQGLEEVLTNDKQFQHLEVIKSVEFIIKKRGYSAIESLSHPKLEKKKINSAEDGWRAFLEMGEDGLGSELHNASEEHDISEEIEEETWLVFEEFNKDKKWSFTDCTSKVVMGSLCIQEAFTFDHHFEQMGFILKP